MASNNMDYKKLKPAMTRRLKKKHKTTPHKSKGKTATPMINSNSKSYPGLRETYR